MHRDGGRTEDGSTLGTSRTGPAESMRSRAESPAGTAEREAIAQADGRKGVKRPLEGNVNGMRIFVKTTTLDKIVRAGIGGSGIRRRSPSGPPACGTLEIVG